MTRLLNIIVNDLQLVLVVKYQLSHHCIYKNELCAILLFRFWLSTDLTCVPNENIEETLLFFIYFFFSSSFSFTSRFLFQFSLDFHWIGIHNAYFIFFNSQTIDLFAYCSIIFMLGQIINVIVEDIDYLCLKGKY